MRRLPIIDRALFRGLLLAVLVAAVLAGCGGGGSGASTFVAQGDGTVMLVQWTRDGDQVTGALSQRFVNADKPTELVVQDATFTGTVHGSSVFLQLAGSGTRTGTLHDGRLDLTYPTPAGGLATLDLGPGDKADFNSAVAAMRDDVASARRNDHDAHARVVIDASAQRLTDDINALALAAGIETGQPATASQRLSSARRDLATTLRDKQKVLAEVGHVDRAALCRDANLVAADATTVGNDLSGVKSGQAPPPAPVPSAVPPDTVAPPTSDPAVLLAKLLKDQAQLTTDRRRLPSYKPLLAPTEDEIFAALRTARTRAARRAKQNSGADKQAEAILKSARAYQQAALSACYAG